MAVHFNPNNPNPNNAHANYNIGMQYLDAAFDEMGAINAHQQGVIGQLRGDLNATRQLLHLTHFIADAAIRQAAVMQGEVDRLNRTCPVRAMNRVNQITATVKSYLIPAGFILFGVGCAFLEHYLHSNRAQ